MTSSFDYFGYVVNIIIILTFLGLLYFGARLLTKKGFGKASGRKMEIIERVSLGTDRYLLMFKVKDKIYIMMVSKNGSELIDTIPSDSFDAEDDISFENNDQFSEVLKKVTGYKNNK